MPVLNNSGYLGISEGVYMRSTDNHYVLVNHGVTDILGGTFSSPGETSSLIENGYENYNSGDSLTGYVEGLNEEHPILSIFEGNFINNYMTIKNDEGADCYISGGTFMGMLYNAGIGLTISDGTFTVTNGHENIWNSKSSEDLSCANCYISGGTFETDGEVNITSNGLVEISGGKFNKKVPTQFIKEGYVQELIDGYYVVKEG